MGDVDYPVALTGDYLALTKLWHVVDALFIWEFLSTIHYEWSVIRGLRPYRWSIWIYSFTRVATLVAAILNLIGLDAATSINCQVWVVFNFIFAYLAFASSSLLVVLRIIAIWNKDKYAVALAVVMWVINISFLSRGIAMIQSGRATDQTSCVILNVESNKMTIIVMFVTDVVLLMTMFVGLLRLRRCGGGTFELGRLLWKQGVIWLLLGTAVELTPVLFICMYLNDALNIMFLMPSLLTMSIAATRMYRSLADFISFDSTNVSDSIPRSDRTTPPGTKPSSAVPTRSDQMTMKTNPGMRASYPSQQHPIPQPGRYTSFMNFDVDSHPSLSEQLRGSSFDDDLESGPTAV